MKKKLLSLSVFAALLSILLIALPVLAQTYYADILVQEKAGTAYAMFPARATQNNDWLAQNNYIDYNALDTRVLEGATPIPHMVSDSYLLFADALPANSSQNYQFTTGNTALNATHTIVGYDGYGTITDDNDIELGSSFQVDQDGWFNTAAGTNINPIIKTDAYKTYVDDGDDIASVVAEYNLQTEQAAFFMFVDPIWGANWSSQTFRALGDINCSRVGINLTAIGAPAGDFTVGIVTADTQCPDGLIYLSSVTVNANTLAGGWNYFDLDADLLSWGRYAIVVSHPTGTLIDHWDWNGDNTGPYARGRHCDSIDSGATWVPNAAVDLMFRVYYSPKVEADSISSGDMEVITAGDFTFQDNYALNFDHTANAYIDCGVIYNAQAKLAISFWFRLDNNFQAGSPDRMYAFGKMQGAGDFMEIIFDNATGDLGFSQNVGGGPIEVICSIPAPGGVWLADTWYHVFASIGQAMGGGAASNGARLRVDGGVASTDANVTAAPNGGNFYIGRSDSWAVKTFEGEIANFCVMTDDVTDAEELALYAGTAPGDETDYWYIDEGNSTAIESRGSAPNEGTAGAACTWETSSRPTQMYISVDGTVEDSYTREFAVPNNANDYIIMQNNSMAYLDNMKIIVSGIEQLYYYTNEITVGNDLWEYNPIINGGFEVSNPPSDWNTNACTFTRSTEQTHDWVYSGKMVAAGLNPRITQSWAGYLPYQGEPITFGAFIYTSAANDQQMRLRLYDGVGFTESASPANDNNWHWVTVTHTLNAAATTLDAAIRMAAAGITDNDDVIYVDRARMVVGNDYQDCAITWGNNPIGVTVTIGSIMAYGTGVAGEEAEIPDAAGEITEVPGMFPDEESMAGTGLAWLYPTVSDIADLTDYPIYLIWWFIAGLFVLLFMLVAHRYFQNILLTGIAGFLAIGMCVGMSFLPGWVIIIAVLVVIMMITMERQPSV